MNSELYTKVVYETIFESQYNSSLLVLVPTYKEELYWRIILLYLAYREILNTYIKR